MKEEDKNIFIDKYSIVYCYGAKVNASNECKANKTEAKTLKGLPLKTLKSVCLLG